MLSRLAGTLIRRCRMAWRRLVFVVLEVIGQFNRDDCLKESAALTYTTLFAVVPLITVTYAALSLLPDFGRVGGQIESFIFDHFVPARGAELQATLDSFANQARDLTAFGVAFVYATALLMLLNVERVLNRIWRVTEPRHGFARIAVYWAVLTVGPPALAAIVAVASYLASMPLLGGDAALPVRDGLLGALPSLLTCSLFTLVYLAVPNSFVPFSHALAGGVLVMLAFRLALDVFAYAVAGSNMQVIYGAFAVVPMFLAWVYTCWVLILFGAIFVRVLGLDAGDDDARARHALLTALRVLERLATAHAAGRGLDELRLRAELGPAADCDPVLQALHTAGYLVRSVDGDWRLGRDLGAVSLFELCRTLAVDIADVPAEALPGGLKPLFTDVQSAVRGRLSVTLADVLPAARDRAACRHT